VAEIDVILGAGASGSSSRRFYVRFGSSVTLVEMLPRVLPIEDEGISAEMQTALKEARHRPEGRHPVRVDEVYDKEVEIRSSRTRGRRA